MRFCWGLCFRAWYRSCCWLMSCLISCFVLPSSSSNLRDFSLLASCPLG